MGVLLSTFGVPELKLSLRPKKVIVGTVYATQITLAYVINVVLSIFVILMIALLEYGVIPSVKQGFYCGDPSISHKNLGDTITPEILGITAALLAIIMLICTELLAHQSIKNINFYGVVFYITECIVGVILTLLVTSIAKVIVGEHRPHFFDTCQPDTAKNCTPGQFVETYTCTTAELSDLPAVDASSSFPSMHSSVSWFVGIFTAYIIHSRMTTVNAGYIAKPFLITVCLTWSLFCSISRITDRRHHWWDVLAGSSLGVVVAIYTIKVVQEKLKDNNSHVCSICLQRQLPISDNKLQNSNGITI